MREDSKPPGIFSRHSSTLKLSELTRAEAKLRELEPTRIYRVDLKLDTAMWNEGFEKASEPWLRIYTDNTDWVNRLEKVYTVTASGYDQLPQDFIVEVLELATDRPTPSQAELDADDEEAEEGQRQSRRFFAFAAGTPAQDLDLVLGRRLTEWDGI